MNERDRDDGTSGAALAGGVGALFACCTVHLLIVAGVIAGMSGLAFGGLVLGIGLVIAAITWFIAWRLRKRHACHQAPHRDRSGRLHR